MASNSTLKFIKKYGNAYLYISPFFLLYCLIGIYPLFYSLYLSFCSWNPKYGLKFIGMQNYTTLFQDTFFWDALRNNVYFMIINAPLMTFLAILIAYMLNNELVKFRKLFQIIYMLPYVTSAVAVGFVFYILFDDTTGWVNTVLSMIGIPPVAWLRSDQWFMITVDLVIIWEWVGYNMLIMLGGLQNISHEIYEAALIDGSSKMRTLFKITIPIMKPIILFSLIMSTIGSFNLFVEPYILSNKIPGHANLTLTYSLYNQTFNNFQLGYGAALGFVIFAFVMIFSIPQLRQSLKSNQ